ncbi:MAG TPA: hypothetical protein VN325_03470 [Steroidobacteraceae bacterium]|nr:hypothetical protein [Steroidobacteraceae bacterium]
MEQPPLAAVTFDTVILAMAMAMAMAMAASLFAWLIFGGGAIPLTYHHQLSGTPSYKTVPVRILRSPRPADQVAPAGSREQRS